MPESLADLELKRAMLVKELSEMGDFRPGSITALVRPCGKPGCRCSRPGDPGHGPNLRLTYKVAGKTQSESLPDPAAIRKARQEIARFRKFQAWSRKFIEVNASICRARADQANAPQTRWSAADLAAAASPPAAAAAAA